MIIAVADSERVTDSKEQARLTLTWVARHTVTEYIRGAYITYQYLPPPFAHSSILNLFSLSHWERSGVAWESRESDRLFLSEQGTTRK